MRLCVAAVVACAAIGGAGWALAEDNTNTYAVEQHTLIIGSMLLVVLGLMAVVGVWLWVKGKDEKHNEALAAARANRRASDKDDPVLRSDFEDFKDDLKDKMAKSDAANHADHEGLGKRIDEVAKDIGEMKLTLVRVEERLPSKDGK